MAEPRTPTYAEAQTADLRIRGSVWHTAHSSDDLEAESFRSRLRLRHFGARSASQRRERVMNIIPDSCKNVSGYPDEGSI